MAIFHIPLFHTAMKMSPCANKQLACLFVGYIIFTSIASDANSTCDVNIHGCDYEVTISAKSNSCARENPFTKYIRQRRSIEDTAETNQPNGPLTRQDFQNLSKKVSKTLDKLSTRVLRWWRKLDRKVNQLATNSRGVRAQSVRLNHQCPDGFIGIKNWPACYLMSHFNTSWYDAKDYCSAFESDLVAMGTVREHFLLTFLIKNNPAISNAEGWWTSGSFLGNTRQWMWTSQFFTKPFTFIKWAEGEPNEDGSQCMLLKRENNHQWNDDICTQSYNFICEIEVQLA